MTEEYRTIEGYEGLYEVSDRGNVRSLNYHNTGRSHILRPVMRKDGYLQVGLCKSGKVKMFVIHRLVAQAFLPNPQSLSDVNHKNEIKNDNRVDNLEWMSRKDNLNYGTHNQRVAEALRGKPNPKVAEALRGKHHSEESKRKMSEARKRYWQNHK